MRRKIFKSILTGMGLGMAFLLGISLTVFAHDPSATPFSDKPHIHIRGRVTTPDGTPIEGARLDIGGMGLGDRGFREMVSGLPTGCIYATGTPGAPGGGGMVITNREGFYEFIIYINTDSPCRNALDRITVDRTRMRWIKEGYDIRPR